MKLALLRRLVLASMLVSLVGAASAADPPASGAAPARTYAIIPIIGDQFSVVSRRSDAGTRLDPNERVNLPIPDAVFDRIAAEAVEKAILDARPGTPVLRVLIRDPRLFALQDKLLAESGESHDMRAALQELLGKAGATDLILVTKQRGEPTFKVKDGLISAPGWLSGIGFYLDNERGMYSEDHRMTGEGFLAPYAYLNVSLLELPALRVVRSQRVQDTTLFLPQDRQPAAHSWDALSAKDKVNALEYVIKKAVESGMTGLLAN